MDLADQVREIKNEVKEINKLLQSGKLRVVVAINPDAKVSGRWHVAVDQHELVHDQHQV